MYVIGHLILTRQASIEASTKAAGFYIAGV
jgi:hypothetical protein